MKVPFSAGSVRAYSTRIPRPRLPQRPPVRTNDPLASATVKELPDNMTFIHRPPPSMPTPHSFTTNPSSALLRPPTPTSAATKPLPETTFKLTAPENPRVSDEVIAQIRQLRKEDPAKFTRSKLASLYGVTENFVGVIAPTKIAYRKAAWRVVEAEKQARRETWGERKHLSVESRRKRREFW